MPLCFSPMSVLPPVRRQTSWALLDPLTGRPKNDAYEAVKETRQLGSGSPSSSSSHRFDRREQLPRPAAVKPTQFQVLPQQTAQLEEQRNEIFK